MFKFFKNDIFTNSKVFGIDIGKWFIYWLGKHGITTVDICCSDGTQTIDEKIATLNTSVDNLEETVTGIEEGTPSVVGFREYEALFTQTGALNTPPTVVVLKNTIGVIPTIIYVSPGVYQIFFSGANINMNKISTYVQIVLDPSTQCTVIPSGSDDDFLIVPLTGNAEVDGLLDKWAVHLKFYN